MSEQWYFVSMGQEIGPVSRSKLTTLIDSGAIDAFTLVREGENGKAIPAEQLFGEHFSTIKIPTEPPKPQLSPVITRTSPIAARVTNEIPFHWLVRCPTCRKQVSQSAESCPSCGHKFTPAVMTRMKSTYQQERSLKVALSVGAGLCFLLFVAYFVITISNNPSQSSYSPVNDYIRYRDSYVRERASHYMSDSEHREAKDMLDNLNSKGYTDSQIGAAINAELERRHDY
jgi:ssDNA-binding Zn-finger/Zn-ribbon topoisomerase 1